MNKHDTIHTKSSDERLAMMCKALGHPARVAILRHLHEIDGCVCGRIVEVLSLAQSTVSEHLRKLKLAGLVRGEVDGPSTCYCIDRDGLELLRGMLSGLCPGAGVAAGPSCPGEIKMQGDAS
ncbi:winged helix-turn-helix transcriptional regulator [Desulfovibrio sulfodismutans]|uniref:Winged helix-turn-helix transcriptional regulator n=1 Tax=Desulfolutivibrio sulfodismutans TaxID=63561 RepID=A0A7K3NN85_9BACT|nr:metalloregulator ArsR/SmtB family transcription factor [Desulfolutivibrio sulfodismutans]NDY57587.1 winged helix-turn-helix transcriptional regulator [Desulfolutivibrio sulfodismutans]QLA11111.1 metalloregulator ArsR/SmtB family transcription factor [Desulfolutivibrio sulfodismutans DSM 3696]